MICDIVGCVFRGHLLQCAAGVSQFLPYAHSTGQKLHPTSRPIAKRRRRRPNRARRGTEKRGTAGTSLSQTEVVSTYWCNIRSKRSILIENFPCSQDFL